MLLRRRLGMFSIVVLTVFASLGLDDSQCGTPSGSPSSAQPESSTAPDPTACEFGTARTLQCPPVFWTNNGHEDPQVYFVDLTDGKWPVAQAVAQWNKAVGIDSYYQEGGSCPLIDGAHCVIIRSGDYGKTGSSGETDWKPADKNKFVDGRVTVRLNEYYPEGGNGPDTGQRRHVTCHELGHATGLGHTEARNSCMRDEPDLRVGTPNADDLALLARVYDR